MHFRCLYTYKGLQCVTCGARNEHGSRSCPILRFCWRCRAKGHLAKVQILAIYCGCHLQYAFQDCPLVGEIDLRQLNRQDCNRCGSWKHHGTVCAFQALVCYLFTLNQNCPSLWRIYTYLTDAERDDVLTDRESKSHLDFDNGGEGYIARDRWCYNCGGSGHLGDVRLFCAIFLSLFTAARFRIATVQDLMIGLMNTLRLVPLTN